MTDPDKPTAEDRERALADTFADWHAKHHEDTAHPFTDLHDDNQED